MAINFNYRPCSYDVCNVTTLSQEKFGKPSLVDYDHRKTTHTVGWPRTRWDDCISAWSRLGMEPAELSEAAENCEVFRDHLGEWWTNYDPPNLFNAFIDIETITCIVMHTKLSPVFYFKHKYI